MQRETAEEVAAEQAGEAGVVGGAPDLAERDGRYGHRGHAVGLALTRGRQTHCGLPCPLNHS